MIFSSRTKIIKEILFMLIVLCYARIFYIVRKTAMKTHEVPKTNGSIRMNHNHMVQKKIAPPSPQALTNKNMNFHHQHQQQQQQQQQKQKPSIEIEECNRNENESKTIDCLKTINEDGQRRKNLAKSKADELKFIDTSFESDLPPTLSQLQRKSVQISIENVPVTLSSPTSLTPTTIDNTAATTIISLEHETEEQQQLQLNLIDDKSGDIDVSSLNVGTNVQSMQPLNEMTVGGTLMKSLHDMGVDSAVEDSTVSIEQVSVNQCHCIVGKKISKQKTIY